MTNFLNAINSMGKQRLLALGVAASAVAGAAVFGISIATSPSYRALSTDLSASEAAEIVRSLEQSGYSPRISADGTMISLPEDDIARARMTLAQEGLPAAGTSGWELFDNASGIGMNGFLQRVNRLRALEGELSRTIQTLDSVEAARVHLVLPERETFSQERPDPSASVIIRMRRGVKVKKDQAHAIRNMIAAAVPDLDPERVNVMSASGEMILAGDDSPASGDSLSTRRATIEDRLARNIESIISARVGAGNVRVRVAAELETSSEVVVRQSFNPEEQVARSTSSLSEESQNTDGANGTVDVANNMPGLDGPEGASGGASESRTKTLDETTFEIGSTKSEKITEAGGVRRLTVAVLINGTVVDDQYQDRSPEELERLASLAKSAVGIDPSRGDVVTVESLQFADNMPLLDGDVPSSSFMDIIAANFGSILRGVTGIFIALIVTLFGIKPILNRMRPEDSKEVVAQTSTDAANQKADGDTQAAPGGAGAAERSSDADGEPEFVSIESVDGGVMRQYIDELANLVDGDPDNALRTIRALIHQK